MDIEIDNQTILNRMYQIALYNKGNNESADLCLQDALNTYSRGEHSDEVVANRILDSLKHSCGIFSNDYQKALDLKEQLV